MNSGVKGIGIDRRCVIKEIERDRKAAEQPKRRPLAGHGFVCRTDKIPAQQEKDRNDQHRIADLARQNRVRQRTDVLAYPVENLTAQVRGKDADDGHAKRLMLQRYSDILNTRDDLTDDQYDEMISWFASVEDWTGEIKDMLDASFG